MFENSDGNHIKKICSLLEANILHFEYKFWVNFLFVYKKQFNQINKI